MTTNGVPARIVIEDGRVVSAYGKRIIGECNRCGFCCSVYEAGFPCKHLSFEILDGKQVAFCNPKSLHGGDWGRGFYCVAYPLPDTILPTCGYRYE